VDHSSDLRREDYLDRLVVGDFPEAVRRTPRRRSAFFDSYLTMLIERDVLERSAIERRGALLKLLALLAGRAGNLLVPSTLAGQSGIPLSAHRSSRCRYRHSLPPHRSRRVKTPCASLTSVQALGGSEGQAAAR
jgi:hypothetical protein